MKKFLFFALAAATLLVGCNKEEPTPTPTLVTKIELSKTEATLKIGESFTIEATVTPTDATTKTVEFISSDTQVATVDAKGLVTAVAAGTADITAKATDGSKVVSTACKVTVKEAKTIFFKFEKGTIKVGGKAMPQSAWYGSIDKFDEREDIVNPVWSSDNVQVATVDAGKVTAVAPGTANISVSDGDGNTNSFVVTVLAATVKDYDYNYGKPLVDCSKLTGYDVLATSGTFTLGAGYSADTQRWTNTLTGYKICEVDFKNAQVDVSAIENPALFVRVYISDISKVAFSSGGEIELRSNCNGKADETEELSWPWSYFCTNATSASKDAKLTLKSGWNNIVLPFALSHQGQTTQNLGGFRKAHVGYFRMFQEPAKAQTGATIIVDQVRVVDWTEFDNCDNFDMWYDRMTDNNACLCSFDTENKTEGKGCFSVNNHFLNGPVSALRLEYATGDAAGTQLTERWPGRNYAMPADMDMTNSKLQFKFYVDDATAFNPQTIVVELGSFGVNDAHNFAWTIAANSLNLKNGWNTITLPFAACGGDASATSKRDIRLINYFRMVLNPLAPYARHTYKIDDIRILKAEN